MRRVRVMLLRWAAAGRTLTSSGPCLRRSRWGGPRARWARWGCWSPTAQSSCRRGPCRRPRCLPPQGPECACGRADAGALVNNQQPSQVHRPGRVARQRPVDGDGSPTQHEKHLSHALLPYDTVRHVRTLPSFKRRAVGYQRGTLRLPMRVYLPVAGS